MSDNSSEQSIYPTMSTGILLDLLQHLGVKTTNEDYMEETLGIQYLINYIERRLEP